MKISVNVWNKLTEAEKTAFRLYCNNHGSNDIKKLIKAIKARFGGVENVELHAYSKVTFNGVLYVWNGDNAWYEISPLSPPVRLELRDCLVRNIVPESRQQ